MKQTRDQKRPPRRQLKRALREPVSFKYRTGLRHAEMEIGKWRAETGARNPPLPFNPLLDNLPPIIKAGDPQGSDARRLGEVIRLAMIESADKRAGGESVLARLSELMFIEVVRRHLEALPPEQ